AARIPVNPRSPAPAQAESQIGPRIDLMSQTDACRGRSPERPDRTRLDAVMKCEGEGRVLDRLPGEGKVADRADRIPIVLGRTDTCPALHGKASVELMAEPRRQIEGQPLLGLVAVRGEVSCAERCVQRRGWRDAMRPSERAADR